MNKTIAIHVDYAAKRRDSYPPIAEQLDALWKGGEQLEAMRIKILEVKDKYPKPSINVSITR